MDSRRVVKIKSSYYVNVPSRICEELGVKKGDHLKVSYLAGVGIIMNRELETDEGRGHFEYINRLQRAADAVGRKLERQAKELGDKFIPDLMARLIPAMAASGVFALRKRVSKLERKVGSPERRRAKIHVVKKISRIGR